MVVPKILTLEELIWATKVCGSSEPGHCAFCPLEYQMADIKCIEALMQQASAALEKYACNGGEI